MPGHVLWWTEQLPYVSACDRDAQTKSHAHEESYTVRLEYSPACGAAWAEVQARGVGRSGHLRSVGAPRVVCGLFIQTAGPARCSP
ncbi:DUF2690 domain-containing protein [Streptomyces sp. NPDC051104]|uniref:DUF2690 domain-containing protein n=1 Tax=Streptomyces sp. NPDC051104 TaxID=3155044 RepID=UPI00343183A6